MRLIKATEVMRAKKFCFSAISFFHAIIKLPRAINRFIVPDEARNLQICRSLEQEELE